MSLLNAVILPKVVKAPCSDFFCRTCELVKIAFCQAWRERYSEFLITPGDGGCKAQGPSLLGGGGGGGGGQDCPGNAVVKLQPCYRAKSSVTSVCCGRSCWELLLSMHTQGPAVWHSSGTASLRLESADEKLALAVQLCDRASSKSNRHVHSRIDCHQLPLQGEVFLSLK